MATLTPLNPAPPADTTVLGKFYLFAPTADIETAIKTLQFEVNLRARREAVSAQAKAISAQRVAEVEEALKAVRGEVFDVETEGL